MLDSSSNLDTSKAGETSVPSMIAGVAKSGKLDSTKYRIRVERFELDTDMQDAARLELLYTQGIDGSGDVIILKEKTFTDKDIMVVVVFYMSKKLNNDPVSVLKTLHESEA